MFPKTKKLPLNRGAFAIVDAEDFDRLSKYNWCLQCSTDGKISAPAKTLLHTHGRRETLSHFILNLKRPVIIMFKNGNPLDHRKSNFLLGSFSQYRQRNRKRSTLTTSKYIGVSYGKKRGNFAAQIQKDGIDYCLGFYETEEEAARAYDNKALELYGPDAQRNFTGGIHDSLPIIKKISLWDRRPVKKSSSNYKGIRYHKKRWEAKIGYLRKTIYLGRFKTEKAAALAYDVKARELCGPGCYQNFPNNSKGIKHVAC